MQQQNPESIDLANEIKRMASFVSARWDKVEHVETLFHDLARMAQKSAVDGLPLVVLTSYLFEKARAREDILKQIDESRGLLRSYDQPYLLLDNMSMRVPDYEQAEREKRYTADCIAYKGFRKLITSEHAHMVEAQPKGLGTMIKHHLEDNEIWEKALDDEYLDSHSFVSALPRSGFDFARDISLISIVQDVESHKDPAVDLLVSSAYKHLSQVVANNNACAVIADLARLEPDSQRFEPVFELEFEPAHHITKTLLQLARKEWRSLSQGNPEQEYRSAVEDHKARKPRTEEEERADQANGRKEALKFLKSIKNARR